MSFSSLARLERLSEEILREFEFISDRFSTFQKNSNLSCLTGCGKCCFKPDIYCTPIEFLPMALEIAKEDDAYDILESLKARKDDFCAILEVKNQETGEARCSRYLQRPVICRTFGVSARHTKNGGVDFSVCRLIKEKKPEAFSELFKLTPDQHPNFPFIDTSKRELALLDPSFLSSEYRMNESLRIMLEKVLMIKSYSIQE